MDETIPYREVLWNIGNQWVMYVCFLAALGCAAYFFYRRYRLWKIGQPENRSGDRGVRLSGAFKDAILQATVLKEKGPGIMHLGMYAGMLVMVVATVCVAAHADLGLPIVQGDFYLYFLSLTVDIAGLVFCIAMVACIVRRLVNKSIDSKPSDYVVLVLLLAIGVTGFVVEGLRIEGTDDPWRAWSPIGNLFSYLFVGFPHADLLLAHKLLWWGHMAIAFGLIAYWMYSKLVHVVLIPGSVYWRSLEPKGTLPYIDLEAEDLETMGVGKLEEFTWKDLYDTEACIRCERCRNNCPAFLSGKQLSPMGLMQDLDAHLLERGPLVIAQRKAEKRAGKAAVSDDGASAAVEAFEPNEAQQAVLDKTLVGDVVTPEALWACTTCRSCMEQCPALLEHVPKIVKMRTYQVSMESAFPPEAQATFRNMETNGNPWGLGWQTRMKWADGLDVPTLAENPDAEYLFWPGCSGAFDSRNRKVTVALIELFRRAGVSFAVLGNEEKCCGDAARRMGNEYLYYTLAMENIATLDGYGVKKIVTQCPHCLNTLATDYPQLGGSYEVVHHTELLARLVEDGSLDLDAGVGATVTYHDSCYLGRYRDIYEQPRMLLSAAGATLVEMDRTLAKSFCCGAGGGRMWLEENEGERINLMRTDQAIETGADTVSTACPYCLTMFADGIAAKDATVQVKDIAEIMVEAVR